MKMFFLTLLIIMTSVVVQAQNIVKYQVDFTLIELTLDRLVLQYESQKENSRDDHYYPELSQGVLDNFYLIIEMSEKITEIKLKSGDVIDQDLEALKHLSLQIKNNPVLSKENISALHSLLAIYESIDILKLGNGRLIKLTSPEDELSKRQKRRLKRYAPITNYDEFKQVIQASGGVSSGGGD